MCYAWKEDKWIPKGSNNPWGAWKEDATERIKIIAASRNGANNILIKERNWKNELDTKVQ